MMLLIIGFVLGIAITVAVLRCSEGNDADIRYVYHRNRNWWGYSTHIITDDGAGSVSVSVEDDDPNVATIHALSVIPSKRRKGYASDLIDAAEDEARYLGANIALISSEKDSFTAAWYQRLGYSFDGEDEHLIQYVKELK